MLAHFVGAAASAVACAASCADPYYISLGGNVAELADGPGNAGNDSDAGAEPACSPPSEDEAMLIPDPACGEPVPDPDRCLSESASVSVESDCTLRSLLDCPPPPTSNSGSLDADSLDAVLTVRLRQCGDYPNALRVRFESGCATSFVLDTIDSQFAPGVLDCVSARLASERYACAERVSCGVGQIFGVPTSFVAPDWY